MGAEPTIRTIDDGEALWFLGTTTTILVDGEQTENRFSAFHVLAPFDAAPPLHSHPQDESFFILEGAVSVWIGDAHMPRCSPGTMAFAPGGTPHSFRVESETAQMLVLSTPAGIEQFVRSLGEPATARGLAPQGAPRDAELIADAERRAGMVRHGPRPEPAPPPDAAA